MARFKRSPASISPGWWFSNLGASHAKLSTRKRETAERAQTFLCNFVTDPFSTSGAKDHGRSGSLPPLDPSQSYSQQSSKYEVQQTKYEITRKRENDFVL